jgi:hypothetical protein
VLVVNRCLEAFSTKAYSGAQAWRTAANWAAKHSALGPFRVAYGAGPHSASCGAASEAEGAARYLSPSPRPLTSPNTRGC